MNLKRQDIKLSACFHGEQLERIEIAAFTPMAEAILEMALPSIIAAINQSTPQASHAGIYAQGEA